MSTSQSSSSQLQSRDAMLNTFHEITGLNIEDCIHFLNQYNWKLQDVIDDFYKGKEFKERSTRNSNEENSYHSTSNVNQSEKNLGDHYTKNDQNIQRFADDRYYAQMLQQYGDADESARRHWRVGHQQQQANSHQSQNQSQENDKNEPIYHEKQELLRCGIHSLNNLFQIPHLFTHQHLDNIVREFNKKHFENDYGNFCIGNYDLRILIEAINRCGYQVRQINFYNGESLQNLPWDSYFGLLININGNHWFTIKNLHGIYYNLDSTFSKPSQIGQRPDLIHYLIRLIQSFKNLYIFTVVQQTNSKYSS